MLSSAASALHLKVCSRSKASRVCLVSRVHTHRVRMGPGKYEDDKKSPRGYTSKNSLYSIDTQKKIDETDPLKCIFFLPKNCLHSFLLNSGTFAAEFQMCDNLPSLDKKNGTHRSSLSRADILPPSARTLDLRRFSLPSDATSLALRLSSSVILSRSRYHASDKYEWHRLM